MRLMTSCRAARYGKPYSNCMLTYDSPNSDLLRMYFRPGMPDSATSSGMVTSRSISSADAARIQGDDFQNRRRRVGIGLDVDVHKSEHAGHGQGHGQQAHDQRVV